MNNSKLLLFSFIITIVVVFVVRGDSVVHEDIIGGTEATTIPPYYAVSIPPYGLCGAVLIHRKFLLTAAHCENAFRQYAILGGGTNIVKIMKRHRHPKYNPNTISRFQYDLCLLELESPVENAAPVTITTSIKLPVNASVITMGYGYTSNNVGANKNISISETLQMVHLNVISNEDCRNAYASLALEDRIHNDRVLCTYDAAKLRDACHGDSGSPVVLVNEEDNEPTTRLVGIVSWGRDCAGDYPAVHMKIDVDFIDSIVPPCDSNDDDVSSKSEGNHEGSYYHLYWKNNDTCIDLKINRMFRAWKSMNFTCGSCAGGGVLEKGHEYNALRRSS